MQCAGSFAVLTRSIYASLVSGGDTLETMRAMLTAVIAAIEAAAVAAAVFIVVSIPAVLMWWLVFDLSAEPVELVNATVGIWQLVHFVPMKLTISASAALSFGLAAEAFSFVVSLAPLGLTLMTVGLAARSGWRFASREHSGAWALLGGVIGFGAVSTWAALTAHSYAVWPVWAQIAVPALVFAVPMSLSFVVRCAIDEQDWWAALTRGAQKAFQGVSAGGAAALPDRAAETIRLGFAGLLAVLGLGAFGTTVAVILGYVEIVTLSQSMHLDFFGALLMFIVQLLFLPVAWVWGVAWFAGPGFAVGTATSVSPFGVLLGPLPAFPLFGAMPDAWGWAGALAPALVVAIGATVGALSGGRDLMRRASTLVSIAVPFCAAILVGLAVVLLMALTNGSVGPGRLAETGASPWLVGAAVAGELAFGMALGVFARRFDLDRVKEASALASLLDTSKNEQLNVTDSLSEANVHEPWVRPAGPLATTDVASDADTVPIEPLASSEFPASPARVPGSAPVAAEPPKSPANPPRVRDLSTDTLLDAYSWEAPKSGDSEKMKDGWGSRLREKLARGDNES